MKFMPILMLMALILTSCASEEEPADGLVQPQIIFMFSPGGLGD